MEPERTCSFTVVTEETFKDFYENYFVQWDECWVRTNEDANNDKIREVRNNCDNWKEYFFSNHIGISVFEDKGYIAYKIENGVFWIEDVLLKKEYRGKGIAKPMVASFIRSVMSVLAPGYEICIYNNSENRANIGYQHLGFEIYNIIPNQYENGEAMIFLRLNLKLFEVAMRTIDIAETSDNHDFLAWFYNHVMTDVLKEAYIEKIAAPLYLKETGKTIPEIFLNQH